MDAALGLIGLYFAIIGFISGLYFTRLDSWYGSVRSLNGKVSQYTNRVSFEQAETEFSGLNASKPTGSFVAVGILATLLLLLSLFVPTPDAEVNPWVFLYSPIIITVFAYWIGGGVRFYQGWKQLRTINQAIDVGKAG